jgi:hypothetical protein
MCRARLPPSAACGGSCPWADQSWRRKSPSVRLPPPCALPLACCAAVFLVLPASGYLSFPEHARARSARQGAWECSASVPCCRRRSIGVLSRADSIVKLEALRKEDPARVIAIWMEYHASKVLRRCASTLPKPYLSHLIVTHRRTSARRGAVEGGACIYIV